MSRTRRNQRKNRQTFRNQIQVMNIMTPQIWCKVWSESRQQNIVLNHQSRNTLWNKKFWRSSVLKNLATWKSASRNWKKWSIKWMTLTVGKSIKSSHIVIKSSSKIIVRFFLLDTWERRIIGEIKVCLESNRKSVSHNN